MQGARSQSVQQLNVAISPDSVRTLESARLRLIRDELLILNREAYSRVEVDIPYPNAPRQKCDWKWTSPSDEVFMIEAKTFRPLGDNAKPNDNILTHILSPYPQQRSALTDCAKLLSSGFAGAPTILIYAYEYPGYSLEPSIDVFEYLAGKSVTLSKRYMAPFEGLIHPVHQRAEVCAWSIVKMKQCLKQARI